MSNRLIAASLVSSLALAGCDKAETDVRTLPPMVMTAAAQPAEDAGRAFTGSVSARVQSNLGFRVAGKVEERFVDAGQSVHAGQKLMRLDPTDLRLAITAQENAAAAAKAALVQAIADEARDRELLAKGWTPRQKWDASKRTLDSARAQLAAADAEAAVARNQGDYAVLFADADGVVMETLAEPGQVVAAGQAVIRLAHAGPREAAVFLPEAVRPALGSAAEASLYDHPDARSPAQLRQLSNVADPTTRTYEARYVLSGAASDAPLGATVTIRLPLTSTSQGVAVPLGALVNDGTRTGVWRLHGDSVSFQPVEIGRLDDETAVLTKGVAPGEAVVALGAQFLHDGEQVCVAGFKEAAR